MPSSCCVCGEKLKYGNDAKKFRFEFCDHHHVCRKRTSNCHTYTSSCVIPCANLLQYVFETLRYGKLTDRECLRIVKQTPWSYTDRLVKK